jgi:hypothetical protein
MMQRDMKKLIAYSSVSHLGFCTLGIFVLNRMGWRQRHPAPGAVLREDIQEIVAPAGRWRRSRARPGDGPAADPRLPGRRAPDRKGALVGRREAGEGEIESPLGPFIAQATQEGYTKKGHKPIPRYGYYYKILKGQGMSAPGGAYQYVINGHMVAGFALVAWPAEYGVSGVMTFIVNQNGTVYQKDLGLKTGELAKAMTLYNPDRTWKRAQ